MEAIAKDTELKLKSFKTWMPLFPGFYDTAFSPDSRIDDELYDCEGNNLLIDEYKTIRFDVPCEMGETVWECFDNKKYSDDVGVAICEIFENMCDLVTDVKFDGIWSPREYNFKNDSIDCTITVDMEKFIEWIYANKEWVREYIHNNFTSCDGFMSFHSNKFEDWENDSNGFIDLDSTKIGSLLDAWCVQDKRIETTDYYEHEVYPWSYVDISKIIEIAEENECGYAIIYHDPDQLEAKFE